jgi:uncharacterized repeat protein (TIGR01451 family)
MNKLLSMVTVLALSSMAVQATDFTNYGVDITNSATLTYKVSDVEQNVENSNTDTFKVDRKVDVTVATTDTVNIVVVPKINVGANNDIKPLTFTVTNNSNGRQDFILNATNLATGADTKDAGEADTVDYAIDLKICVDATCSAGDISGTNIQFNEEENKTYYVFADIPDSAVDGEHASIVLTATAVEDGTTTVMSDNKDDADRKTEVDIVFAEAAGDAVGDAQYDGKHSDLSAYEVVTAMIDVTKYSCVINDGISTAGKEKRIPGATIRYALDVNNTGTAATEGAVLSDTLQGDVTYVENSGVIKDAACNCASPAGSDTTDTVTVSNQNVTANFGTVDGNAHECAYFEVKIK